MKIQCSGVIERVNVPTSRGVRIRAGCPRCGAHALLSRAGQLCSEFIEVRELAELDPDWAADLIERAITYCRAEAARRKVEPSQVAKKVFAMGSTRAFALTARCPTPDDSGVVE